MFLSILGVGTFFIGCLCLPLGFFPLLLGILEIRYAAQLLRNPAAPALKPAFYLAFMEILETLLGNVISLIVGVTALILYNDVEVRRYFGET